MIAHVAHGNAVKGGGILFSEALTPVLSVEQFLDPDKRGRAPITSDLRVSSSRGRRRRVANSAEAIRAMKAAHGVPSRPVPRKPAR